MPTKVAAFRCDADRQTGAGHLVRCGALAGTLRERGWQTLLLTRSETRQYLALTENAFDTVCEIERETCTAQICEQISSRSCPAVAIIDDYGLTEAFEREVSRHMPVVIFDDLPNRRHVAQLLVDPTPEREAGDYAAFVPNNCRLLTGPSYAILRPPFLRSRAPRSGSDPRRAEGFLVAFGATDPQGLIPKTIALLRAAFPERAVTAVCSGTSAVGLDVAADRQVRVLTNVDASCLAQLMDESALAVGAAGSASWERCACALPSVVTAIADNQNDIARGLRSAGAAVALPPECFTEALAEACVGLVTSGAAYSAMSAAAVELCDGEGVRRVAAAIETLLAAVRRPVGLPMRA